MPLCTPASTSGELPVGVRVTSFAAPPTTRLVWRWVEDVWSSLASTGIGCVVCGEVGVGWGGVATFWKSLSWLLCGWRCFYWRSQCGRCCTHAVLFSALRTFGICVRASQRSSSIASPLPHTLLPPSTPPPNFEPAGLPHICIKMKSCRDKMLWPYSSGSRGLFSPNLQRAFCMRSLKLMR